MAGPEILVPLGFFAMVTAIVVGTPYMRAVARRMDREAGAPKVPADVTARLERMEQAIDAIAVEVERISEGQRFTTRLLSERNGGAPAPSAQQERAVGGGEGR
jgi:hypothetical protein